MKRTQLQMVKDTLGDLEGYVKRGHELSPAQERFRKELKLALEQERELKKLKRREKRAA